MLRPKNSQRKTIDYRGKMMHFDEEGYFYFNMKNKNDMEHHVIHSYMINMNNNKRFKNSRNYLYYQQIEFKTGDICASLTKDGHYERAKIINDLDYDSAQVLFIDSGHRLIVSKLDLEPLPDQVRQIDPLIDVCKISNIRIIDEIKFREKFKQLIGQEISLRFGPDTLLNRILGPDCVDKCLVRSISFLIDGKEVKDVLISEGIAENNDDDFVYHHRNKEINEKKSNGKITMKINDMDKVNNENDNCDAGDDGDVKDDISETPSSPIHFDVTYTKHVYITSFLSSKEFYVQESTTSMKDKLGEIQKSIDNLVMKYQNFTDNVFNKRNVYLTQFTEDMYWYRVKILKYDEKQGFLVQYIDWGNFEYKKSLNEFILLTREMGYDAKLLMDEEGMAQQCQLERKLRRLFKKESSIRKLFIREFLEPVKRIKLEYKVRESRENVWLVKGVFWHGQGLEELIKMFENQNLPITNPLNNKSELNKDEVSSHSDYEDANKKVMDYLITSCDYNPEINGNGDDLKHSPLINSDLDGKSPNLQHQLSNPASCNEKPACCHDCTATVDNSRIVEFREYLITYINGLDEIWVDLDDGQTREMCQNLMDELTYIESIKDEAVTIGHMYITKHDNKMYRCQLIDIRSTSNQLRVHLLDKGPIISIGFDNIYSVSDSLKALPFTVTRFRLPPNLLVSSNYSTFDVLNDMKRFENKTARLIRESPDSDIILDLIFNEPIQLQYTIPVKNNRLSVPPQSGWSRSLLQTLMISQVFSILEDPNSNHPNNSTINKTQSLALVTEKQLTVPKNRSVPLFRPLATS